MTLEETEVGRRRPAYVYREHGKAFCGELSLSRRRSSSGNTGMALAYHGELNLTSRPPSTFAFNKRYHHEGQDDGIARD